MTEGEGFGVVNDTDELIELRAEAELLGVKVDRRWGVDRLRDEIITARSSGDIIADHAEPDVEFEPEPESERESELELEVEPALEPAQPPVRAGGHINRYDGRGWVLEEGK